MLDFITHSLFVLSFGVTSLPLARTFVFGALPTVTVHSFLYLVPTVPYVRSLHT
jgi:hypothetical protein